MDASFCLSGIGCWGHGVGDASLSVTISEISQIVSQGTAAGSDLDVKKGVPAGFTHSAKYIMTFNPSISLIYEKGRNDTCDT